MNYTYKHIYNFIYICRSVIIHEVHIKWNWFVVSFRIWWISTFTIYGLTPVTHSLDNENRVHSYSICSMRCDKSVTSYHAICQGPVYFVTKYRLLFKREKNFVKIVPITWKSPPDSKLRWSHVSPTWSLSVSTLGQRGPNVLCYLGYCMEQTIFPPSSPHNGNSFVYKTRSHYMKV